MTIEETLEHIGEEEHGHHLEALKKPDGKLDPIMIMLTALVILIVVGVFTLVYLIHFHVQNPADFNGTTLISETVEPGGTLEFYLDWCENSLAPRSIHRTWVNSEVVTQPPLLPHPADIGCYVSKIQWAVPDGLTPGEYMVRAFVAFDINHFTQRHEHFEVGPVIVVESDA